MKRSKILSLILGVGMIGAVSVGLAPTAKTQGQTTGTQNVRVLTNRTTNKGFACVVNGNGSLVLTNANGETTGYVSVGQMLSIKGQANGKTLVTVEETGATGYIANSNMKMINSGVNSQLVQMNRRGHIINVSSDVHLRANATMDSSILANLTNGANITITGQQGEWYRVNVNGVRGYIFGEYVGQGATQTGGVVNIVGNVNPTTIKNNNNNTVNTVSPTTGTVGTTGATPTSSSKVAQPSGSINGTTKNTISNNEQHENTPVKVVSHTGSTTSNKEQHKAAPAKQTTNNQITVGSQEFYNIINSEMIQLTNNYRTSHGLNAVQGNSVLASMANWKANNCAKYNYFSDYTPNGQTVYQQPQFKNVKYSTFAENLAEINIGQSSGTISYSDTKDIAEMCFGYLTGSPSHLANIMDSQATEIGIGVAVSSNGNVIVSQDFGANVTQ